MAPWSMTPIKVAHIIIPIFINTKNIKTNAMLKNANCQLISASLSNL
jgi:hypothetical protein